MGNSDYIACSKCGVAQSKKCFHNNKTRTKGVNAICKECANLLQRKRYYARKEAELKIFEERLLTESESAVTPSVDSAG